MGGIVLCPCPFAHPGPRMKNCAWQLKLVWHPGRVVTLFVLLKRKYAEREKEKTENEVELKTKQEITKRKTKIAKTNRISDQIQQHCANFNKTTLIA